LEGGSNEDGENNEPDSEQWMLLRIRSARDREADSSKPGRKAKVGILAAVHKVRAIG
jgi:hypothetical protein